MPVDPAHGRNLPAGRDVARLIQHLGRRHAAEAVARIQQRPHGTLYPLTIPKEEVDAIAAVLAPYAVQGARYAARLLNAKLRRLLAGRQSRSFHSPRQKGLVETLGILFAFDVFNPRILDVVRTMAYHLAASTLATSYERANVALAQLRNAIGIGVEEGMSHATISRLVNGIFADPNRAFAIAQTETSRAVHAGQLLYDQESGVVVGKQWLASSDACDSCLKVNGMIVALNQPFAVVGSGPYSVIQHPPFHPSCLCSMLSILAGSKEAESAGLTSRSSQLSDVETISFSSSGKPVPSRFAASFRY